MTPSIFLSYSRQDWEYEIRKAISDASVVLVCLSSTWVNQRGYIQKEMKLALEAMKEVPDGQIHTIPIRLDDCAVPDSLLEGLDYFRIDHQEWSDKPYFRCQIHSGKSHLFIAHAQLGNGDFEHHMPKAYRYLVEVLTANPYSMKGGASDRLPRRDAEVQNLNYRVTLEFAIEWFQGWGGGVLEMFGIPQPESDRTEKRIRERLYEIGVVLKARGSST
jgi:hypothetical protein